LCGKETPKNEKKRAVKNEVVGCRTDVAEKQNIDSDKKNGAKTGCSNRGCVDKE